MEEDWTQDEPPAKRSRVDVERDENGLVRQDLSLCDSQLQRNLKTSYWNFSWQSNEPYKSVLVPLMGDHQDPSVIGRLIKERNQLRIDFARIFLDEKRRTFKDAARGSHSYYGISEPRSDKVLFLKTTRHLHVYVVHVERENFEIINGVVLTPVSEIHEYVSDACHEVAKALQKQGSFDICRRV